MRLTVCRGTQTLKGLKWFQVNLLGQVKFKTKKVKEGKEVGGEEEENEFMVTWGGHPISELQTEKDILDTTVRPSIQLQFHISVLCVLFLIMPPMHIISIS